jgi:hypothetical protein
MQLTLAQVAQAQQLAQQEQTAQAQALTTRRAVLASLAAGMQAGQTLALLTMSVIQAQAAAAVVVVVVPHIQQVKFRYFQLLSALLVATVQLVPTKPVAAVAVQQQ